MCDDCKLQIQRDDAYNIHHKDGNTFNNNMEHLTVVHTTCHEKN